MLVYAVDGGKACIAGAMVFISGEVQSVRSTPKLLLAMKTRSSLELLETRIAPAGLNILAVTSAADSGPGTLRDIVAKSHADALAHPGNLEGIYFTLPAGTKTITLASEIVIADDTYILGLGAGNLTITGGGNTRLFEINDGTAAAKHVTLNGLSLTLGHSTGDGGAIRSVEALTVLNSLFGGCTANGNGGGLAEEGTGALATLTVSNSEFINNSAYSGDGGGVYASTEGNVTITSSLFSTNYATNYGGGAHLVELPGGFGNLVVANSSVIGNVAENDDGGGLLLQNRRTGATAAASGYATVYDSLIVANSSARNGGGVSFFTGNDFVIGSLLINNHAVITGGGISTYNDFQALLVTGSTLEGNSTTSGQSAAGGGGLFAAPSSTAVTTISNSAFTGNQSGNGGGGAYADGSALVVQGSSFGQNAALSYGGGLLVDDDGSQGSLTLSNSQFASNHAGSRGGALTHDASGALHISTASFTHNTAGLTGGAINVDFSTAQVTIFGVFATGNLSENDGGAMYLESSGSLIVDSVQLTGNFAYNGGALFLNGTGGKTLSHALLSNNTAVNGGGGLTAYGSGALSIGNALFTDNVAASGSGGAYAASSTPVNVSSTVLFTGNTSPDGLQKNF